MRCPVHNVEGCSCEYAARFREAMLETGELPPLEPPCPAKAGIKVGTTPLLAMTFAAGLLACGPRPDVCSERDAALLAREADCLARVKSECAGIPIDEPCAFEDACNAFVSERCQ